MPTQKPNMKFKSLDSFLIKSRGKVVIVENPRDCKDFNWLRGQTVEIDGTKERVKAVESYTIPNHKKGENIGILLDEAQKEEGK